MLTAGLAIGYQPTKYFYKITGSTKQTLGISDKYPYDWFMGGTDTCQAPLSPLAPSLPVNRLQ